MASCNECIHNELCDIHGHMNANDCRLYRDKCEPYREFATKIILGISKMPFQNKKSDIEVDTGYKECALDACRLIDNTLKELTEKNDKE